MSDQASCSDWGCLMVSRLMVSCLQCRVPAGRWCRYSNGNVMETLHRGRRAR